VTVNTVHAGVGGRRRCSSHRRPCSLLIHGLSVHGKDAVAERDRVRRLPVHLWLGPCISTPDADGSEVLSRELLGVSNEARPVPSVDRQPPLCFPADLHEKCFKCLSSSHKVATCRMSPCCLRCKGFGHLARECKRWWRVPPSSGAPGGQPWRLAQVHPPAHIGTAISGGATPAGRGRRRRCQRRRHQSWLRVNTTYSSDHAAANRGEPANSTDSSCDAAADRGELANGTCLLGLDPLMLTMGPHDLLSSHDAMDNSMLEKFVASLTANRIAMCPTLDRLASTSMATLLEVGAKTGVTCVCNCGQRTLSQLASLELQPPTSVPFSVGYRIATSIASTRAG
jgi:hypothetical protein